MRRRGNIRRSKNNKSNIDFKKYAIPACVIAILILFFSIIFSIANIGNKKIIAGVRIGNIDVSNLTQEEAIEKLNTWEKETMLKDIKVKYQDIEENIKVEQLNPKVDVDKLVREACNIGKTGNILKDNYEILYTLIFKKNIELNINYDENKLNKKLTEINSKLPNCLEESEYYIEENNLIIKTGKSGIIINEDELKKELNKKIIDENK